MSRRRRSIYIEDALYAELERAAGVSGRSTNAEICLALRAYVGAPARGPDAVRANRPGRAKAPRPVNAQAVELVELLEAEVLRNGRPEHLVSATSWYDPARLLLERDKRPFEEALALVRWSQRDTFWRANVLSMDTFRRQYDKLRLQRNRNRPAEPATSWEGKVRAWARFAGQSLGVNPAPLEAKVASHLKRTGALPTIEELAA